MNVDVKCPLCNVPITLRVTVEPILSHSYGNGRKGFMTANTSASG